VEAQAPFVVECQHAFAEQRRCVVAYDELPLAVVARHHVDAGADYLVVVAIVVRVGGVVEFDEGVVAVVSQAVV